MKNLITWCLKKLKPAVSWAGTALKRVGGWIATFSGVLPQPKPLVHAIVQKVSSFLLELSTKCTELLSEIDDIIRKLEPTPKVSLAPDIFADVQANLSVAPPT